MKKFLYVILLMLFACSANAQWQQVYTIPNWIYTFTASGNNIYLGASSSGLHTSFNNGANWSQGNLTGIVYTLALSGPNIIAA